MQHNEPGFGAAFEQLHRTPDDHERVAAAFARVTNGSLDWADAGAQLAADPGNAAEILGFTPEAAHAHEDDPEGHAKFHFYQREIGDAMAAYARSGGTNTKALYHAADHVNDVFVHHKHAPVLGLASSAAHMTDEELAAHQTGIEAAAFATPEMVGIELRNPFKKKKKEGTAAASSSSAATAESEKKKGFFSRGWGATKRFAGSVASKGKKVVRKAKEAVTGQIAKLKDLPVDASIKIYKNSRGNSSNQVFLNPGQIRRLYSTGEDTSVLEGFIGKIADWRLPPEAWEGIPETISMFDIEMDIEEGTGADSAMLLKIEKPGEQVGNFLAFGSARRATYPFAQLYLWDFGAQGRKFTWNSQKAVKINAIFKQTIDGLEATPTRYDFSAKTKPTRYFDFLGKSASDKFVGGAMDDFEDDLDQFKAGELSNAYKLWKSDELFVIDLAPKVWRSPALAPRLRLYCTHVVPDKYWRTSTLEVTIKFASLQLAVESQGVGAAALNMYVERKKKQREERAAAATPGAASAADVAQRGERK